VVGAKSESHPEIDAADPGIAVGRDRCDGRGFVLAGFASNLVGTRPGLVVGPPTLPAVAAGLLLQRELQTRRTDIEAGIAERALQMALIAQQIGRASCRERVS
jgi:hypothetical protein